MYVCMYMQLVHNVAIKGSAHSTFVGKLYAVVKLKILQHTCYKFIDVHILTYMYECKYVCTYLAARRCISKPKTVAHKSTHKILYFAAAPLCKSDSMLPGSKYAMDMRNPGPVNAHNLRKLKLVCMCAKNAMRLDTNRMSFNYTYIA